MQVTHVDLLAIPLVIWPYVDNIFNDSNLINRLESLTLETKITIDLNWCTYIINAVATCDSKLDFRSIDC